MKEPTDKELSKAMMRFLQVLSEAEVAQNEVLEDNAEPSRKSQEKLAEELAHRFPGTIFYVIQHNGEYAVRRGGSRVKEDPVELKIVTQYYVNPNG